MDTYFGVGIARKGRLEPADILNTLGLEEILFGSNVTLIEWAEKLEPALSQAALQIRIEASGEDERRIVVRGVGEAGRKLVKDLSAGD